MSAARWTGTWAMAAALLIGGCASHSLHWRSEREMQQTSALLEAAAAGESRLHRIDVRSVRGRSVQVAIEEIGCDGDQDVIVLIHGVLSDRGAWRYLRGELADHGCLWLVDLLGCGESSLPDPDDDPELYSLDAHAHDVWTALREMSARRQPAPRITLVGHSLGTGVVLRMLGDAELREEFAATRSLVQGAVLFAPLDVAMHQVDPKFERIVNVTKVEVLIGDVTGILDLQIEQITRDGWVESDRVPREEADRLIAILTDPPRLDAAKATLRRAIPFRSDRRPAWERIEAMVRDYPNVDVPCLLVSGARDETLPTSMAYKLQAQLPDARLVVVERAMHSIPLEHPRLAADLVASFVDEPIERDDRMAAHATGGAP